MCERPVKSKQKAVEYSRCKKWTHDTCGGISPGAYLVSEENDDLWYCPDCLVEQLPFAKASLTTNTSAGESEKEGALFRISCLFLNARSLVNKRYEFKAMLMHREPKVVVVTETFLNDEILSSEIVTDSYNTFRRDRNRHGGGVLLLVHEIIPCRQREDLESDCELIWVQLSLQKKNVLVGVYYSILSTPSVTEEEQLLLKSGIFIYK